MANLGEPIGKTVIKVGLDDTEIKQGLTNLNARMKIADNQWKANLSTFKQSDRSLEKLSTSLQGMTNKFKVQSSIVDAHKVKVEKLAKEYGENSTKVLNANAAYEKQRATLGNLKRNISEVTKEINDMKRAEAISKSPWGQKSKELDQYAQKMKSVSDKFTNLGQNMTMAVTAPIAGLGAIGVKTAMEFDAQMSRVGAIANTTGGDFKKMKQLAMELGASTTKSASEVAKGMEEMAAKGYSANEIMKAMPGVIAAAEASGSDMAQTAEVMSSAMNAFGLEASKSTHVADVLAQTANQSAADITDMQYALKYAGAPAKALGMSLEETSASIGMMVDAGLKGEQAGTTLRGALLGLLSPSEDNYKRMKKLGIEITDNNGNFVGMSKLIGNMQGSMEGMTKTQKAATLAQLVGKEAVSGMLVLMEKSPKQIDSMTNALKESDGASEKASKAMMNNLKGAVEEMKGAFETLGIQIGQDLTPMLQGAAKGMQKLADGFSSMPGWARKTAVGIGLIAAATGPVILGIGMMAKAASTAAGSLSKLTGRYAANTIAAEANAGANAMAGASLSKSSKGAGLAGLNFLKFGKNAGTATKSVGLLTRGAGLLRGGLGLLGGPIGIAITAVTALVGGFKLAYKHIDWFRTGVDNTGKLMKQIGSSIDFSWAKNIGLVFKVGAAYVRSFGGGLGEIVKKGFEMTPGMQAIKLGFGVVNNAVSKATDQVNVFGKGVSKSSETALKGYTDLSMKASLKLEQFRITNKTIGEKQYQDVKSLYSRINNEVSSKLEDRHQREMTGLRKIFAATNGLKASEEQKILAKTQSGNNAEVKSVEIIQSKILAIYRKAKSEKRSLTKTEETKIAALQQQMDQKVVASLSKSEKEQRIILGRLKSNKSKLSLEAAAAVIKHSAKERDESIKNAKKQRDKVIDEAIYQRDVTKNISKKQADAIIKNAEKQYKESKKNAEKQHKKVVDEASAQNKGVRKHIDAQTGRVKSKWEESWAATKKYAAKQTVHSISKALEMYNGVKKWNGKMVSNAITGMINMKNGFSKWFGKIGDTFDSWKTSLGKKASSLGKGVANSAIGGLNGMIGGINTISSAIMDKKLLKKIPKLSTGTVRNGAIARPTAAIVGDRGRGNGPGGFRKEIIQKADGTMYMTPNRDTLVHLDKGDRVINGTQTHEMMKSGLIPRFSKGTGFFENIADKWSDGTKFVKKIAGDVWDFIENPKKLVDSVLAKVGGTFKGVGGLTGDLAGAAFSKMKSALVSKVKEWFDEYGGGDGLGGVLDPSLINYHFGRTAAYTAATGRAFHEGVDFPFVYQEVGTPMSGTVKRQSFMNGGYGNWVKVVSGAVELIFAHLKNFSKTPKDGSHIRAGQTIGLTGNTGFSTGPHLHFGRRVNGRDVDPEPWLKELKAKGRLKGPAGSKGSASAWADDIRKAARQMKVSITSSEVQGIISQINRESSGNQNVTQSMSVWDINTMMGNPAKGLLQFIPSSFKNYAVRGHNNILSGYDQLLAFFNNSNWRRDLPYGRRGWGPTGHRRFANGGVIDRHQMYEGGEEGPEMVIPLIPKRRKRAQQLLAQASSIVNKNELVKLASGTTKKTALKQSTYKIKSGDTLWGISRQFNMTVDALKKLNNLKTNLIFPNQILKLNGTIQKLTTTAKKQTMQTRSGSVLDIAKNLMNSNPGLKTTPANVALGKYMQDKLKNMSKQTIDTLQKNISDVNKKIDSTLKTASAKVTSLKTKVKTLKTPAAITSAKNELKQYEAQIAALKKLKQNEVLKSQFINALAKQRKTLIDKMAQLKEKENQIKEEKTSFKSNISSNLMGYAGFGAAKGHTARDFVSFMQYRLNKMKKFASNVTTLKSMGLDTDIIKEMLEGGIESAMPRAEALIKGGRGYIGQINSLQREVKRIVESISTKQAGYVYDAEIKKTVSEMKTTEKRQQALDKKKVVYLNQKKKVTAKKPVATKKPATVSKLTYKTHKIAWGDTLGGIASKYGTSVSALKKANNLSSDMIYAGKTLKVPTVSTLTSPTKAKAMDASTKYILETAKKLNVVGKNDKYVNDLKKEIDKIKKDKDKKNDQIIKDLEKAMKSNANKLDKLDKVADILEKILHKDSTILLDGQKVSKTVEKKITTTAKKTTRRKTS